MVSDADSPGQPVHKSTPIINFITSVEISYKHDRVEGCTGGRKPRRADIENSHI